MIGETAEVLLGFQFSAVEPYVWV